MTIEIGDERQVRTWPVDLRQAEKIAASHVARYGFAKGDVVGRRVCDVACGVGYGSFFLSQWADEVVGMDISDKAINWAEHYFKNDNQYCPVNF